MCSHNGVRRVHKGVFYEFWRVLGLEGCRRVAFILCLHSLTVCITPCDSIMTSVALLDLLLVLFRIVLLCVMVC